LKHEALTAEQSREVLRIARSVTSKVTEEKSFVASIPLATNITTGGVVVSLSAMSQGVTVTTRVGDRVRVKKMQIKYTVIVGATGIVSGADKYNSVRVIIFKWRVSNAITAPTAGNILDNASSATSTNMMYNHDGRNDYHIVYDKTHVVFNTPVQDGTSTSWEHGPNSAFTCEAPITLRNLGNREIAYESNTTTGDGLYFALAVSDSAFTPNPTIELSSIITYSDA